MPESTKKTEQTTETTDQTIETPVDSSTDTDVQIGERVRNKEKAGDFELSEDAQNKLKMNADFSLREGSEEEVESEETTEETKDSEKTGEETQTEQSETEKAEETEDTNLVNEPDEKVLEFLQKYETPESRERLAKDLIKFRASNTQKAQEVASIEKELSSIIERLDSDKVSQAIEKVQSLKEMPELRDTLDDFFDEENPVTELIDALTEAVPKVKKMSSEQTALSQKEQDLDLKEEELGLMAIKDSPFDYSDMDQKIKTGEIADEYNTNLLGAHKIREAEHLKVHVKDNESREKALQDEVKTLKEEVSVLKKKKAPAVTEQITEPKIIQFNRVKRKEGELGDMDATEERLKQKILGG